MAVVIDGYRRVLLHAAAPDAVPTMVAALEAILLVFLGYRFFKARERAFADII